jgi:HD-like signal output (HDOD) protein
VKQSYLDNIKDLPVMPEVAVKVLNMSESPLSMSFKDLETIIKVDPGLTAKILKIANSALYARQREIKSLQMAITLLGFKNIRNVVLLISASRLFPHMQGSGFHAFFWKHAILAAFLSRSLAVRCGRSDIAEEAFVAGLLHDIGQAILYTASPAEYAQALEAAKLGALLLETIETQMFGTDHREIGGAVLTKWNFPALYSDVALEHESLNITSPYKSTVILVSVACLLAEKLEPEGIRTLQRDILLQLMPYTCLSAADADTPAAEMAAALENDPLYREFRSLFGLS